MESRMPSKLETRAGVYEQKKARIVADFNAMRLADQPIALSKSTSNIFRGNARQHAKLDVKALNQVIAIDVKARTVDVEGMTSYETLVDAVLPLGLAPAVVPELKTITVGGVYAGIGVETASGKYGFMHETVLEAEILTADGRVLLCSPTKNKDLFYGFPNSYGSLGYALRIKLQLFPVKPYVKLARTTFRGAPEFIRALSIAGKQARAVNGVDFVEGTVLSHDTRVVTVGTFVDSAPWTRDIYKTPFYKSIATQKTDYLTTRDYFFRYDPDWFWCSRHFGLENPLMRALMPKSKMRSDVYYRFAGWTARQPLIKQLRKLGWRRESLIQDVEAPTAQAAEFVTWFDREIGMVPYLVAPVQQYKNVKYPLSPITPGKQFMNIGFYAPQKTKMTDALHYTKLIDRKVLSMKVRKMLYSVTTLSSKEFWSLFSKRDYDKLKKKYDPHARLTGLYEKVSRVR